MANNQKHGKWDALWTGARLATMTGGYAVIEDGAVGISDGRISWVGERKALPAAPEKLARTVHDAKGKWLTPGLIDCHTHIIYGGDRSQEFAMRLAGKSYADIAKEGGGIMSTVRATRAASEDELLASAQKRLASLLAEGVTTVEIKSGYGLDTPNEIKMLRVAKKLAALNNIRVSTTFLGAHTLPAEYKGKAEDYVALVCGEMLPAVASAGLADAVDGFCESIGFSARQMARIFDAAKELGLRVKLHAEQLSDQGGAQLAAKYGALSADHLEHASEAGVKALADSGTVAVLLPGAFYMLHETRKPPVELLRQHGVPMALSTDCNPGTSPITSLLSILNMGCVLFGLSPEEALLGVTRNAALALGLGDHIGTIETGKDADLALWDIAHPVELSYHLGYNPCVGVIKKGVLSS